MKDKLAFIDHSYHQKSKATRFIIDLLQQDYDIDFFWDNGWNSGQSINLADIAQKDYKTIIFFQVIHFREHQLQYIKDKNVVVIPMYDASPRRLNSFWYKYTCLKKIKFINFSHVMHLKLSKMGFPSHYYQYFIEPKNHGPSPMSFEKLTGFFWQRTNNITWKQIKKRVGNTPFDSFTLHSAVDPPGCKFIFPSEADIKKYNIQITNWFTDHESYLKELDKANIYFAPRLDEGIGMSFLEAMARGKCVVAPNRPTMNEYIIHGKTGILYHPFSFTPIHFENYDLKQISRHALDFMNRGFKKWNQEKEVFLDLIEQPVILPKSLLVGARKSKAKKIFVQLLGLTKFGLNKMNVKNIALLVKIRNYLR